VQLAFSDDPVLRLSGAPDLVFQFTVTLWQLFSDDISTTGHRKCVLKKYGVADLEFVGWHECTIIGRRKQ